MVTVPAFGTTPMRRGVAYEVVVDVQPVLAFQTRRSNPRQIRTEAALRITRTRLVGFAAVLVNWPRFLSWTVCLHLRL